jgi:hypothetical protein
MRRGGGGGGGGGRGTDAAVSLPLPQTALDVALGISGVGSPPPEAG